MIKQLVLKKPTFLKGSACGVVGATALVTLEVEGSPGEVVLDRLSSYKVLTSLNPATPHFGVDPENWISGFVQGRSGRAEFAHIFAAHVMGFQRWAHDPLSKAIVLSSSERQIQLAIPWLRQEVCKKSLNLALKFTQLANEASPKAEQKQGFREELHRFLRQAHRNYLSPNTVRFALAALQRGVPVATLSHDTIELGWGASRIRMRSSFTSNTSSIGSNLARNKLAASRLFLENKLPVPRGTSVGSVEEADKAAKALGWPVVIKPGGLDQGAGVTPGIKNSEDLHAAFLRARELDKGPIILEEHVEGADHRMLIVQGQLLMTTQRIPAGVTGDGKSTIVELIKQINKNPLRGTSKRNMLIKLKLDDDALACLGEQNLNPGDIPDPDQFVALNKTANISTGGTAIDVSDIVHPDNRAIAIRAARLVDLDIAGVDFLCPDISKSYREVGGAICEVNAQPGFRPHWLSDPDRDINGEVLDILTGGSQLRIPTAAITGTNGKSTTAKMFHHMWQASGAVAGVCTTAGTWVGEQQIERENLSGYPGARLLFQDPTVESAIIELPRKGLLMFGHPCDHYDVVALLNIADDHIGVDGVNSMAEMERLKAQVIARARKTVVLNADDDQCMDMQRYIVAPKVILTARHKSNAALATHLENQGWGVFIGDNGGISSLIISEGDKETAVIPIADIPETQGRTIEHNILNALWATALASAQGLPLAAMREGIRKV